MIPLNLYKTSLLISIVESESYWYSPILNIVRSMLRIYIFTWTDAQLIVLFYIYLSLSPEDYLASNSSKLAWCTSLQISSLTSLHDYPSSHFYDSSVSLNYGAI